MLWFYCQRQDSPRVRKTEKLLAGEFIERRFNRISMTCDLIPTSPGGNMRSAKFPVGRTVAPLAKLFLEHMKDGDTTVETMSKAGIALEFATIHNLRLQLATSGFPFIETTI
jgi:hypothetical protein